MIIIAAKPSTLPAELAARRFRAVVVGCSAGGLEALMAMLRPLGVAVPAPILVAQHLHKGDRGGFAGHLDTCLAASVVEASDKAPLQPGQVVVAPADYHLLVERGGTLALSVDPKVNWSRPSIDVLFESAAWAYRAELVAIVLSGANADGAHGCQVVRNYGGLCMAQDPATADSPVMPRAAIELAKITTVLPPEQIGALLMELAFWRSEPGPRTPATEGTP